MSALCTFSAAERKPSWPSLHVSISELRTEAISWVVVVIPERSIWRRATRVPFERKRAWARSGAAAHGLRRRAPFSSHGCTDFREYIGHSAANVVEELRPRGAKLAQ